MRAPLSRPSSRQFSADSDLVLAERLVSPQTIATYASPYAGGKSYALGLVGGDMILLVVHTIEEQNGEEEIYIISADVLAWFRSRGKKYQT